MAFVTITKQDIVRSGLEATYEAANAGGNQFVNHGTEFIHVKNGGGSSCTATLQTTITVDGAYVVNKTVVIPIGEERLIGPFPRGWYSSMCQIAFTQVASVTIACLDLVE